MDKISVVVPCFNEEESIELYYKEMQKVMNEYNTYTLEYWFIDDGSKDNTLKEIEKLREKDDNVHYVSFSRNFGKESALYAGLEASTGEYVAVMDVDLQDPPKMLPEMLQILHEDKSLDCVGTARSDREGEGKIKSFFSDLFYKIINKLSDTKIVNGARDYRLMSRRMVIAILSLTEYNRFSKGIFSWVGFNTKYLEYKNEERAAGTTSWNFKKLAKYAMTGIVDFSEKPLHIATWSGLFFSLLSVIAIIFILIRKIVQPGSSMDGWTSMISVILLVGGILLLCIGILGEYVGKIFMEVKKRPIYIIRDKK